MRMREMTEVPCRRKSSITRRTDRITGYVLCLLNFFQKKKKPKGYLTCPSPRPQGDTIDSASTPSAEVGQRLFLPPSTAHRPYLRLCGTRENLPRRGKKNTAIFAQMLQSPLSSAEEIWGHVPSLNELPALRLGSDIMFAYWLRNNANPRRLRYYFVNDVLNDETLRLCTTILKNRGHHATVPVWPGVQLDWGSVEFDMLLGESSASSFLLFFFFFSTSFLPLFFFFSTSFLRLFYAGEMPILSCLLGAASKQRPGC